jgi:SARP family transcriptional regulator, regulator of embCAB operon
LAGTAILRVHLAGTMLLERGDVLVRSDTFPGRQGRLAFAMLAAERSRPIHRDELADELWEGSPPNAWESALRAIASKLRSLLAGVGVDGDPIPSAVGCYQLRLPANSWVDLEAADDAVHKAETALRAGDPDAAMGWALVGNAIARRPLLPGEDGRFATRWRARLNEIRIRSLGVRAQTLLHRGEFGLAVRDAGTILELAPYRETAYRLLMRAHASAGDPAEALRVYERCRDVLAQELGVDPSRETQDVYLDVLRSM